jgi:hypothetical protein
MIKIVIALSLVLPLVTLTSTPGSGPHDRSCAASSWPDSTKSLGELLEDDTNLMLGSLLAKNLHQSIDTAAIASGYYCFDSKDQRDLDKKVLALFKLKGAFLI